MNTAIVSQLSLLFSRWHASFVWSFSDKISRLSVTLMTHLWSQSNLLFPLWQQSTPNQTQIFKCELIYREYRIAITVRPIENLPGMWPEKALDWLSYNHATTFWLDPSGHLLHSSYQIMVMHSNFGPFVTVKLKPKSDLVIPTQYTIYQLFLPIYVTSKRDNKSDKTPN